MPEQPGPVHDQVIAGMSRVEAKMESVERGMIAIQNHLGILNGSVAKVISDVSKTREEFARHPLECKWGSQIQEVNRQLLTGEYRGSREVEEKLALFNTAQISNRAALDARQQTDANWWREIRPIVWVVAGGLLLLLLYFADIFLRHFGVKP